MFPFRGVRYVAERVSDLAAVTSPPYDVIDPDDADRLERLDPHNVVRLILPRNDSEVPASRVPPAAPDPDPDPDRDDQQRSAQRSSTRYAHAARLLQEWIAQGVLARDSAPAMYVYEQRGSSIQRGLIASVALSATDAGIVLPHEDVMPGPVADRRDLMRATRANLEPILLVYDGGGDTAAVLDEVCAQPPDLECRSTDDSPGATGHSPGSTRAGLTQRLWVLTDPAMLQRISQDLAPRQALIADGHHRWAAYRQLQSEQQAAGAGAGPWDAGLAMLVDSRTSPLHVKAIHRVVSDITLAAALDAAHPTFQVEAAGANLAEALTALERTDAPHPFVITDGTDFGLVSRPHSDAVEAALPAGRPQAWKDLDASVLHHLLLDRLWEVPDVVGRIDYLHDAEAAVRAARRVHGVAVLLRPVAVAEVLALAAAGERMPRKSTSFGPKPRTGLVLRLLDD